MPLSFSIATALLLKILSSNVIDFPFDIAVHLQISGRRHVYGFA